MFVVVSDLTGAVVDFFESQQDAAALVEKHNKNNKNIEQRFTCIERNKFECNECTW